MKFVGIRPTQIYYKLKKSLNMLKTYSMGVIQEFFLASAVNFVIFMAQRPSANIALLRGRAKFTRVLTAPGYEDDVGLKTDSSTWKDRLFVVPSEVY